jgi:hypothetical protein
VESIWVYSALLPPIAYCASPGWLWWWRNWWNDWQGKPKYSEKTCLSAVLSTTNPTCCPDANPGRRGGKPASNRLSCVTARACRYTDWAIRFPVFFFRLPYYLTNREQKITPVRKSYFGDEWSLYHRVIHPSRKEEEFIKHSILVAGQDAFISLCVNMYPSGKKPPMVE